MNDELLKLRETLVNAIARIDAITAQLPEQNVTPQAITPPSVNKEIRFNNANWPLSWPSDLVVGINSDREKQARATQIVAGYGIENLEGKVILDYGCGDGYIPNALTQIQPKKIIGYDLSKDSQWTNFTHPTLQFTDNFTDLLEQQVDVILVHDVIDHIVPATFENGITKLLLKSPHAKILLTAHPFTGRHGGHLHEQLNLAYLHLLYTEDELADFNIVCPYNNRWSKPQAAYENMFNRLGLEILEKQIDHDELEPWIIENIVPIVADRTYQGSLTNEQVQKIMRVSWVYYVLKKK